MGSVITLTTDFGSCDGYQGVLEGVIYGINPNARVVTISHEIPPQDIAGGWYLIKTHHRYFPPGTVHVAVVDPGVGSKRKIIAVTTCKYKFIAPDNGLLSFIPNKEIISIHSVTNRKYALAEISPVFHGRDIMAPAAAYLSLGINPSCLGRASKTISELPNIKPIRKKNKIFGRVIWVDRFGNMITNIESTRNLDKKSVSVNGEEVGPIQKCFSDVKSGKLVAYIGSGGHLEIAVRNGSAFDYFSLKKISDFEIVVA
ncbi:MAG: SAM-dependent chlorinase/fluorinase [candidate division Zixibacteria bacterium]